MKEKAGTAPAIVCAMYYKLPLYLSLTLICTKCKDHFKTKKLAVIDPDTWKLEPWPWFCVGPDCAEVEMEMSSLVALPCHVRMGEIAAR